MTPTQLPLDLPFRAASGHGEFIISDCNQLAADMVDRWPDWSGQIRAINISGPAGAGKSHLASVWREMSEAVVISRLDDAVMETMAAVTCFVLDDVQPGPDWDETLLFMLLNRVKDCAGAVAITSRTPVSQMAWHLPDLRSRLRAIPLAEITAPDDQLLLVLLEKYFAERQLAVPDTVLHYLIARMERSFAAVTEIASALDTQSLAGKRQINLALAREILAEQADDTPPA